MTGSETVGRPAAFLDRDGTLIVERHYLARPEGVQLIEGAVRGLARLRDDGRLLVVVTNQSGIARGLYDDAAYRAVQARLEQLLGEQGIVLDGTWYCPHHPDFTGTCDCRKPGVRLFRDAAETLGIDLARSVYIGDRVRDVTPAVHFGGLPILVRTGPVTEAVPAGIQVVTDLPAAAEFAALQASG